MPLLTPELRYKEKEIEKYMVRGKIRDDAPAYIFEWQEELDRFYDEVIALGIL